MVAALPQRHHSGIFRFNGQLRRPAAAVLQLYSFGKAVYHFLRHGDIDGDAIPLGHMLFGSQYLVGQGTVIG